MLLQKNDLKHLLTLPILTVCSSSGLQPDQMACLWRGSWPENRPEALWEQTHFHCVRRILKCGKPCAAAAPSSREAGEGVWPGHVRPCAGSRGSAEEGNCETWSATTHTHARTADGHTRSRRTHGQMGGGPTWRAINRNAEIFITDRGAKKSVKGLSIH